MQKNKQPGSALADAFLRVGVKAEDFSNKPGPSRHEDLNGGAKHPWVAVQPTQVDLARKGAAKHASTKPSSAQKPNKILPGSSRPTLVVTPKPKSINKVSKHRCKSPAAGKKKTTPARIQPNATPSPSLAEYLAIIKSAYHSEPRRASRTPTLSKPATEEISISQAIAPNPNAFSSEFETLRLVPANDGIAPSLSDGPDETEIYIGLDFGTSSTKVVLQDSYSRASYAVPFIQLGKGNPFLFPSRVYLDGNVYSLDKPAGQTSQPRTIRDLKITLMKSPGANEYMLHATAFLALIIRHARGWLFSIHGDTYKSSQVEWGLNLGLPAEKSEDPHLSTRFKAMALAAINLANEPGQIDKLSAARYLDKAKRMFTGANPEELGLGVHPDMVGIFPEIAAQVVGFVESESWDAQTHPYIVLIDVGAGTVDVSFFSVEGKDKRKFQFFQNKVSENGVMNLHRERVNWLKTILLQKSMLSQELSEYLDAIYTPTDRLAGIPNSVEDYIFGLSLNGNQHVDNEFKNGRYRKQVYGDVIRPVYEKRVPYGSHWGALPVFVCGGGSRMPLYRNIVSELNATTGVSWLKARQYSLSKPKRLIADGLSAEDYDRLSVSYGLSFPAIGEIIKSGQIKDFKRVQLRKINIEAPTKDVC